MRRLLVIAVLLFATLFTATPANAWWRHHWGFRGGWHGHHVGWRHPGWGWGGGWGWGAPRWGWGWGGWGHRHFVHRRFVNPWVGGGFYSPGFYSVPIYSGYSPWFGCYNDGGFIDGGIGAGTSVNLGIPTYGTYAAAYRPTTNAAPTALAVQQFLGLKDIRPLALDILPPAIATRSASPSLRTLDDILTRVSTIESHRKAERLIREGDELFRVQNYHSALQKYKLAAVTAPDLPEALWRKGHALVATRNYELAATAFKRAIGLTDDLGREGFRLNDLYAGAQITKSQHLESLAEWAISRDRSPDPYFLLGLFLNYDGQSPRAEKFFQKASDLAGISGGHIAVFLDAADDAPSLPPAGPARPAVVIPVARLSAGTEI